MTISLAEIAKEKGIKYFLISYTDLFGAQRAKLVPACEHEGAFVGAGIWDCRLRDHRPVRKSGRGSSSFRPVAHRPWQKPLA